MWKTFSELRAYLLYVARKSSHRAPSQILIARAMRKFRDQRMMLAALIFPRPFFSWRDLLECLWMIRFLIRIAFAALCMKRCHIFLDLYMGQLQYYRSITKFNTSFYKIREIIQKSCNWVGMFVILEGSFLRVYGLPHQRLTLDKNMSSRQRRSSAFQIMGLTSFGRFAKHEMHSKPFHHFIGPSVAALSFLLLLKSVKIKVQAHPRNFCFEIEISKMGKTAQ